jgi:hypothetical protein
LRLSEEEESEDRVSVSQPSESGALDNNNKAESKQRGSCHNLPKTTKIAFRSGGGVNSSQP